ncbi:SMI1/KNR4 family protein [Streptomyces sp. NBC_00572]|uniref:SMI1/KNR4 family protein n=1 Tax=Streptomyces sp. NBC_00572 TaxID=2903664 RepID=UPI0022576CE5|nr:SMI1/KNR4 family protein [Streptomyces sp. NBC_00572]MCX4985809.1 SMI1/KNR4 family protein [Streptomyces sp. NBC_00572]
MIFIESDGSEYVGPPLDAGMVQQAESILQVRPPKSYLDLLFVQNGGVLRNRCFPTKFPTSWAPDHVCLDAIWGISGAWGVDVSSPNMIAEWSYPEVGVVFGITPSAGHDTMMLDYSECGPLGEPSVSYIDEDRVPSRIVNSFSEFLHGLVSCRIYGDDAD